MYLREYPEDISGVCLISPFLGYSGIIAEISAAGSLAAWNPGQFDPKKDWERMFWDQIVKEGYFLAEEYHHQGLDGQQV